LQTFKTDRIRQTIPYIYYSARGERHSDFNTSWFIQLVRMPSRIYNRGELEKSAKFNLTGPKTMPGGEKFDCRTCVCVKRRDLDCIEWCRQLQHRLMRGEARLAAETPPPWSSFILYCMQPCLQRNASLSHQAQLAVD